MWLPSYRDTLARFLYSPEVVRPGRPVTFYTFSLARLETGGEVTVRRRGELYRDLLPRIRENLEAPPSDHPCFTCEHRETCYPSGSTLDSPIPAEEQLFPLAYYESFYLPCDPLLLACDEAAAVLGGAPIGEALSSREHHRGLEIEPQGEALAEALSPPNQQLFFEGDRTGLFIMECLYLKLSGLAGVLHGLIDLSRKAGRPHLALSPARLRGTYRRESSHLPVRWSIDLQITDAVTTAPLATLDRERVPDEPVVWAIPQPRIESFLPSAMLKPQVQTLTMRVEVNNLEAHDEGPRTRLSLVARLVSESYSPADHGKHDLVRVVAASSTGRVVFGGRMVEASPGSFVFQGQTAGLEAEVARRVQERLSGAMVEVVIARAFGAPSDLVALGRLFLRFLFWNDRGDAGRLEPARLERAAARLAETAGAGLVEAATLRAALEPEQIAFGPRHLLYRSEDRDAISGLEWGKPSNEKAGSGVVPDSLWNEVWTLALRMATTVPGWSFCRSLDDYPAEDPAAPLEQASRTLDGLAQRARGALLGSSGRNRVALEVCQDFWNDLEEAGNAGAAGPSTERTMVVTRSRRGKTG